MIPVNEGRLTAPFGQEINRFSIFYCCVTNMVNRELDCIEAQASLPHPIFTSKPCDKKKAALSDSPKIKTYQIFIRLLSS